MSNNPPTRAPRTTARRWLPWTFMATGLVAALLSAWFFWGAVPRLEVQAVRLSADGQSWEFVLWFAKAPPDAQLQHAGQQIALERGQAVIAVDSASLAQGRHTIAVELWSPSRSPRSYTFDVDVGP